MRRIKVLSLGTLYDFPSKAQRSSVEEAWKLYKKQNDELLPGIAKSRLAEFNKNFNDLELVCDLDYEQKLIHVEARGAGVRFSFKLRNDFVEKVTFQSILRSLG